MQVLASSSIEKMLLVAVVSKACPLHSIPTANKIVPGPLTTETMMLRLTAKLKDLFLGSETAATVHILLLLILCGVLYLPYLGNTPFFDKGEPREALAVQDIVQRGEWLFPLKRATAIPSKPPLFHWSAALVATVTGKLNETTIRFPSALYATLGVLLVYLLGRKLYGGEVGLLAGAILATTMV
jgi:predicted membrane-bound mannosyltransferase